MKNGRTDAKLFAQVVVSKYSVQLKMKGLASAAFILLEKFNPKGGLES